MGLEVVESDWNDWNVNAILFKCRVRNQGNSYFQGQKVCAIVGSTFGEDTWTPTAEEHFEIENIIFNLISPVVYTYQ